MTKKQQTQSADALFAGTGEIQSLCRSIDWDTTPLGPAGLWPQSLRLAVKICLSARFPTAVWAGPELVLVYNEGYQSVLGPSKHPWALGRRAREVWPESWERLGPELDTLMQHGESTIHEDERLSLKRGRGTEEEPFFTYSFTPIREDDGPITGVLNVAFERISGRPSEPKSTYEGEQWQGRADEAVRASEARLREAQRLARLGSWEWTVGSTSITWSEGLHLILGREVNLGAPSYEVLPQFYTQEAWEKLRVAIESAVETGTPYELEVEMIRQDGTTCWTITRGEAVRGPNGAVVKLRGTAHDISERKRVEEERERLFQALREAEQRRNHFLGLLSHELRNPLTPIHNSLYLLERATPGGERDCRARAIIRRQVNHLERLIDDLLDVTRFSRGKIRLQRQHLNLVDVVRQTVEDHSSLLEGREVEVELPHEPLWMSGDSMRLAQVVGNLLNNAAKFTPEGEKVSISLARAGGCAVVEVVDTGVGIAPDVLPRIFEPFAQAERSLARTPGGLGLGLALVKGLVEQHGGTVKARSEGPGEGAHFTLKLPLAEQPVVTPADELLQKKTGRGRRVLIIEDNVDAADTLCEVLELIGHEVRVAYSGREGIATGHEFKPDLVLCDIGLPQTDGYAVARAFRADAALKGIFLVALTGYVGPEDQRRAAEAGFERHLAKPPTLQTLNDLLATYEAGRT